MEKLPFMATENIMMESVKRGKDRQEVHEAIRVYSHQAAHRVKMEGLDNNLIDLISADPEIPLTKEEILQQLDPAQYIGRSSSQVDEFVRDIADPIISRYHDGDIQVELSI